MKSAIVCLLVGAASACATVKEADLALKEWTSEHLRTRKGDDEKSAGAKSAADEGSKKGETEAGHTSKDSDAVSAEHANSQPADPATPAPTGTSAAAAEALFESGHDAMNEGDYDTACARFKESNRLDPAVGAVLNLAVCEERRGRLATAWQLYKRVMNELPAGDDRYPIAQRRVSALRPRVPRVTLQLAPNAPEQTSVIYGDVVFGPASFNVPLPMDPGKHEFTVRAPGHEERSYDFKLVESEKKELVIQPGKKQ